MNHPCSIRVSVVTAIRTLTLLSISTFLTGIALAAGDKVFSENSISQVVALQEVSEKKKQINRLSGRALIRVIKVIESDDHRAMLEKEFLLMQSVARLRTLLQNKNKLLNTDRLVYLEQLQLLSRLNSFTQRQLSDGNHYQIIKAFPFDQAAKSSLQFILDLEKIDRLWRIMEDLQFEQLVDELPEGKNYQVKLLTRAIDKLGESKMQLLLNWSKANNQAPSKLPEEVILTIALRAKDLSAATGALWADENISLHHHFPMIAANFNPEQRFEFFREITKIADYASMAMYQIEQLAVDDDLKKTFYQDSLADSNSGSSAAHILSRDLSIDQINELAETTEISQNFHEQKNALLALLLSDNAQAKQKSLDLYRANKLAPKLAQEVAAWFK